jgi:hypothetical protein
VGRVKARKTTSSRLRREPDELTHAEVAEATLTDGESPTFHCDLSLPASHNSSHNPATTAPHSVDRPDKLANESER